MQVKYDMEVLLKSIHSPTESLMASRNSMAVTMHQFSVPQIEYPLGGSSKTGSHVYFLLQVFWVVLLFDINVVLMLS